MFEDFFEKGRAWLQDNKLKAAAVSVLLVLLALIFVWTQPFAPKQKQAETLSLTSLSSSAAIAKDDKKTKSAPAQSKAEAKQSVIMVDVKGAVKSEGVYRLAANSRVADAIKMAGGLTEQADKKSVNLAQKLTDEQVIYVAKDGENVSVIGSSINAATSVQTSETASPSSTDKINLNTATLADLQTISGIGEKRAQDILDYRDSKGGFTSIDELTEISGIGDKTLDKLKAEVTLD